MTTTENPTCEFGYTPSEHPRLCQVDHTYGTRTTAGHPVDEEIIAKAYDAAEATERRAVDVARRVNALLAEAGCDVSIYRHGLHGTYQVNATIRGLERLAEILTHPRG